MTDIATRNRNVKRLLEAEFGRGKVRVRNGKGTSYGWCKISIDVTPLDPDEARELRQRAHKALEGIEFGKWFSDDYSDNRPRQSLSISLNEARYERTFIGQIDGVKYGKQWYTEQWEPVATEIPSAAR